MVEFEGIKFFKEYASWWYIFDKFCIIDGFIFFGIFDVKIAIIK